MSWPFACKADCPQSRLLVAATQSRCACSHIKTGKWVLAATGLWPGCCMTKAAPGVHDAPAVIWPELVEREELARGCAHAETSLCVQAVTQQLVSTPAPATNGAGPSHSQPKPSKHCRHPVMHFMFHEHPWFSFRVATVFSLRLNSRH